MQIPVRISNRIWLDLRMFRQIVTFRALDVDNTIDDGVVYVNSFRTKFSRKGLGQSSHCEFAGGERATEGRSFCFGSASLIYDGYDQKEILLIAAVAEVKISVGGCSAFVFCNSIGRTAWLKRKAPRLYKSVSSLPYLKDVLTH
jgi:hypothetical protein